MLVRIWLKPSLFILMSLVMVSCQSSQAQWGGDAEQFCQELKIWPRNTEVPADEQYIRHAVAIPVNARFVSEKLNNNDWVLVDVRSKNRRRHTIPGAVSMTANLYSYSEDEFGADRPIEKLAKKLHVNSTDSVRPKKIILFCDDLKCFNATYGACRFRQDGLPFENIHVFLGGVSEWASGGFPMSASNL